MFQRYDCHACFSSDVDHIQLPLSPKTAQVLHEIRDDLKVEKGWKWWVAASSGSSSFMMLVAIYLLGALGLLK